MMAWPHPVHVPSVGAGRWAPLVVSLSALAFTIMTFWWNNWRRGRLTVGYPRTFAATTASGLPILTLPLTFQNTGAIAIGVRALRVLVEQDRRRAILHHVRTRTGMRLQVGEV